MGVVECMVTSLLQWKRMTHECKASACCCMLTGAAVFVPLTTLFLVKYVGLNRLTNAYGLLSMVKGLATIAGPPIAGAFLLL